MERILDGLYDILARSKRKEVEAKLVDVRERLHRVMEIRAMGGSDTLTERQLRWLEEEWKDATDIEDDLMRELSDLEQPR